MTFTHPFDNDKQQIEGLYNKRNLKRINMSDLALQFLDRLLKVDPSIRISAEDALKDPWFKSFSCKSHEKIPEENKKKMLQNLISMRNE